MTKEVKEGRRTLTLNIITAEYLDFCRNSNYNDLSFRSFFLAFDEFIPFSLYQRINEKKLMQWAQKEKEKNKY